jgi:hypothetical protein
MNRTLYTLLIVFCAAALASAQEPSTDTPATPPAGNPQRGGGASPTLEPQPYEKVITKEPS